MWRARTPYVQTLVSTREGEPNSADSLTVGNRAGQWLIESELGRGGMGVVYAVRHVQIGKRAALKVMHRRLRDPDAIAVRMVQEAQVVNAIGHPNIIDVFDVGTLDDGRPYIVMEQLVGHSLSELAPDLDESLSILAQVADALIAAHAAGVVHRDLKPDNIFLVEGEPLRVKLLDWGIARVINVPTEVTYEGQVVGTPRYIAPEQARGERVTPQTDVYSLGVVAYELLLGRAPFDADTPTEVMAMHLLIQPPAPRTLWPEIPTRVERLLHGMLAKHPDARPSMTEVALAIAAAREERKRKPQAVIVEDVQPRRKHRWLAAATLGAVAVLAFVWFAYREQAPLDGTLVERPREIATRTITNPVVRDCADPSVLQDGNRWVMTCTGNRDGNLYPMHVSTDLTTWRSAGWIFRSGQRPAWGTGHYWAPELHRTRYGVAAYFSMRADNGRNAIGVATAPSVDGPYRDIGKPLVAPDGGASDAHVLVDGEQRFLYFKRDDERALWVQPLSADGRSTRDEAQRVLVATEDWEHGNVEAPSVLREGDFYYLFYSGARYCDSGYALGVARARSPLGPFEKLGVPVLRGTVGWLGPGHSTVVTGAGNERYLAYHAYHEAEGTPSCKAGAPADNNRRHVRIEPLVFDGGWPLVGARSPTSQRE